MAAVGIVCGVCGGRRALHVDARRPDCRTEPASAERGEFPPEGVCDACWKGAVRGSRGGPKAPQERRRT